MRVSIFITCFNDTLFPATGRAVVKILERVGCTVRFPEEQTCCGQLHINAGYAEEATAIAERQLQVFADAEAIVTPSASCAATMQEHYPRLVGETPPVYEFCSFLTDVLKITDVGASFPHKVTYHPTCSSLRSLRVGDGPLRLLRGVRDIELVELPQAESCCGFGGTFAVKNSDVSSAMLEDKMTQIIRTGAEFCTAIDNSCLMHIEGGLSRSNQRIPTMHVAEILASGI